MDFDVSTTFKTCDGAGRSMTCANAVMLFTFGICSVEVDALLQASEQVSIISLWHREKMVRILIPIKDFKYKLNPNSLYFTSYITVIQINAHVSTIK